MFEFACQRRFMSLLCLFVILSHGGALQAETITLANGNKVEGRVLKVTGDRVVIRFDHNILAWPRSFVASEVKPASDMPPLNGRLATWGETLDRFAACPWATEVRDIPATVIDKGVLRAVPYSSYRCSEYELNVYGDPADPACVEIGVYRGLLQSAEAKRNCLTFMLSLLSDPKDRKLLEALDVEGSSAARSGLTLEVTPPTAEDAYGGWWISIYHEDKLEASRASKVELDAITQKRVDTAAAKAVAPKGPPTANAAAQKPVLDHNESDYAPRWTASDMEHARRSTSSGTNTGGGRVYVRGYYRKDGTYVRPHTRSRSR